MDNDILKVSVEPREFLYPSNILSLSRIFLLPFIIFGLTKTTPHYKIFTLIMMLIAVSTDALDGQLARRSKKVSALGKILDPLGDKLCIGAVAVSVTILRDFPAWAMVFIIFRDVGILTGGLLMVGKWTVITSSNIWGKATSLFQSIAIMAYAFGFPLRSHPLTVAMVFTAVSSLSYAMEFYHLVKKEEGEAQN